MAISRSSRVLAGDPFFGALLGGLVRGGVALGRRVLPKIAGAIGGIIKRGGSKTAAVIRSGGTAGTIARGVTGVAATAGGVVAAERVFGGRAGVVAPGVAGLTGESLDGFLVMRSASGRISRLISPQGRIVRLTRRRGGISARELRGFRKVAGLLGRLGMRPSTRRRRK